MVGLKAGCLVLGMRAGCLVLGPRTGYLVQGLRAGYLVLGMRAGYLAPEGSVEIRVYLDKRAFRRDFQRDLQGAGGGYLVLDGLALDGVFRAAH